MLKNYFLNIFLFLSFIIFNYSYILEKNIIIYSESNVLIEIKNLTENIRKISFTNSQNDIINISIISKDNKSYINTTFFERTDYYYNNEGAKLFFAKDLSDIITFNCPNSIFIDFSLSNPIHLSNYFFSLVQKNIFSYPDIFLFPLSNGFKEIKLEFDINKNEYFISNLNEHYLNNYANLVIKENNLENKIEEKKVYLIKLNYSYISEDDEFFLNNIYLNLSAPNINDLYNVFKKENYLDYFTWKDENKIYLNKRNNNDSKLSTINDFIFPEGITEKNFDLQACGTKIKSFLIKNDFVKTKFEINTDISDYDNNKIIVNITSSNFNFNNIVRLSIQLNNYQEKELNFQKSNTMILFELDYFNDEKLNIKAEIPVKKIRHENYLNYTIFNIPLPKINCKFPNYVLLKTNTINTFTINGECDNNKNIISKSQFSDVNSVLENISVNLNNNNTLTLTGDIRKNGDIIIQYKLPNNEIYKFNNTFHIVNETEIAKCFYSLEERAFSKLPYIKNGCISILKQYSLFLVNITNSEEKFEVKVNDTDLDLDSDSIKTILKKGIYYLLIYQNNIIISNSTNFKLYYTLIFSNEYNLVQKSNQIEFDTYGIVINGLYIYRDNEAQKLDYNGTTSNYDYFTLTATFGYKRLQTGLYYIYKDNDIKVFAFWVQNTQQGNNIVNDNTNATFNIQVLRGGKFNRYEIYINYPLINEIELEKIQLYEDNNLIITKEKDNTLFYSNNGSLIFNLILNNKIDRILLSSKNKISKKKYEINITNIYYNDNFIFGTEYNEEWGLKIIDLNDNNLENIKIKEGIYSNNKQILEFEKDEFFMDKKSLNIDISDTNILVGNENVELYYYYSDFSDEIKNKIPLIRNDEFPYLFLYYYKIFSPKKCSNDQNYFYLYLNVYCGTLEHEKYYLNENNFSYSPYKIVSKNNEFEFEETIFLMKEKSNIFKILNYEINLPKFEYQSYNIRFIENISDKNNYIFKIYLNKQIPKFHDFEIILYNDFNKYYSSKNIINEDENQIISYFNKDYDLSQHYYSISIHDNECNETINSNSYHFELNKMNTILNNTNYFIKTSSLNDGTYINLILSNNINPSDLYIENLINEIECNSIEENLSECKFTINKNNYKSQYLIKYFSLTEYFFVYTYDIEDGIQYNCLNDFNKIQFYLLINDSFKDEIDIKNLNSNSIIFNKISSNQYFISSNNLQNNFVVIDKNSKTELFTIDYNEDLMNKSFPLLNDKIKIFDISQKNDLFINHIVFKFSNEININEIEDLRLIKNNKTFQSIQIEKKNDSNNEIIGYFENKGLLINDFNLSFNYIPCNQTIFKENINIENTVNVENLTINCDEPSMFNMISFQCEVCKEIYPDKQYYLNGNCVENCDIENNYFKSSKYVCKKCEEGLFLFGDKCLNIDDIILLNLTELCNNYCSNNQYCYINFSDTEDSLKCESYTYKNASRVQVYNRIMVHEKIIFENNIKKFSSKNITSNGYINEYNEKSLILTKTINNSEKKINNIKDSDGIFIEFKNNYIKIMDF